MSDALGSGDQVEAEFVALAAAHNALATLDAAARRRVLLRLCARFAPELPPGLSEQRRDEPVRPPVSVVTVDFGPDGYTETATFTSG